MYIYTFRVLKIDAYYCVWGWEDIEKGVGFYLSRSKKLRYQRGVFSIHFYFCLLGYWKTGICQFCFLLFWEGFLMQKGWDPVILQNVCSYWIYLKKRLVNI